VDWALDVGTAFGPEAGLEIVDGLLQEPRMQGYQSLPSVRAVGGFCIDFGSQKCLQPNHHLRE